MATIKLRERALQDGRVSLYLDIYEDGHRRYEFLKLYIMPETNEKIKAQNRDTRKLAEVVRGKRLVEAQNTAFGFAQRREKVLFVQSFEKFRKGRNSSLYDAISAHLREHCSADMKVAQVNERWLNGYIDYLDERGASPNSIAKYIGALRVFWRWANRKGIVSGNPFYNIRVESQDSTREYLTIEELRRLIETPTKYKVRNPFLFSCFTGLRWSDVSALRWGDVEEYGERTRIRFRQKKTGAQEYMDLNNQAVALMGERGADDALIFDISDKGNDKIDKWVKAAGIKKHITFHCARHTFATMLLTLDTDIYTVSKLLGHTDISTTQIYAKIVDKKKQEAVDRIPQML